MQQKIKVERLKLFETLPAAEAAADWIGEARAFPLVDTDREPVGWIVEHQRGTGLPSASATATIATMAIQRDTRGTSRRDEPRIAEYFLADPAAGKNVTATPSFGVDFCRFAFAPHSEPIGRALCGVPLFLRDQDGNRRSIGTPEGGKPWL